MIRSFRAGTLGGTRTRMPTSSHILGIIPARGGSQGIPRKNLVPLLGKPLLAYTAEAAKASSRLTRRILSTEDEEIAAVGRSLGLEVPFLRPNALATDETPMLEVVRNLLQELASREKYHPAIVVLLQPTSPLRRAGHIDAAIDLLEKSGADTVVSVLPVPHQFTPSSLMRLEGDHLVPFVDGPMKLRRQEKPLLFARNGPAVLAVRTASILKQGLYDGVTLPLIMDRRSSLDIDTEEDLEEAASLLRMRQ